MLFPVFAGRYACDAAEGTAEAELIQISTFCGNFCNGVCGEEQLGDCVLDTDAFNKMRWSDFAAEVFVEQSAEGR